MGLPVTAARKRLCCTMYEIERACWALASLGNAKQRWHAKHGPPTMRLPKSHHNVKNLRPVVVFPMEYHRIGVASRPILRNVRLASN